MGGSETTTWKYPKNNLDEKIDPNPEKVDEGLMKIYVFSSHKDLIQLKSCRFNLELNLLFAEDTEAK